MWIQEHHWDPLLWAAALCFQPSQVLEQDLPAPRVDQVHQVQELTLISNQQVASMLAQANQLWLVAAFQVPPSLEFNSPTHRDFSSPG